MIAYFDTSALVPLLVDEPSSSACRRLWDDADDVVSTRLAYVEAAAALCRARRLGRLTSRRQRAALRSLEELWSQAQISRKSISRWSSGRRSSPTNSRYAATTRSTAPPPYS